ncbi:TonB-dependent receptor domain-containing protein [Winogradskyella rapida]|uniref:TonB-dependent receptor domain-containing protein n=1 Tax=Winogradskyella rapida TaxID=549701 RepID=A0ABW3KSH7_9FLAO
MNKPLLILISFLLSLSLSPLAYSQTQPNALPLIQILSELEKKHQVTFSYEPQTIANLSVKSLNPNYSLEEALQELRTNTPLNFKILNSRFITIALKIVKNEPQHTQRLNEVVVTNYLTKGISKLNNGTIKANTKGFNMLPGLIEPDVLQIIQNLPGIISIDERISNINIRGGTNDQNLILYEGIRMYQSGHFFGLISAFNPYLTEEISISKNGTSARFGDAVSSTIAIKSKDVIDHKTQASIGGNLLSVDGFAKTPISPKSEIQLSARRAYTDVMVTQTYDAYFERIFQDSELNNNNATNNALALDERFLFYDFNAKFLYDINATSKIRFNALAIRNRLDYNQAYISTEHRLEETKSKLNQLTYGASANYTKAFNSQFKSTVELYYSQYDLDAKNENVHDNLVLTQENKVEDYGLRLDFTKTVNTDLNINTGYQFNEVSVAYFEDVNAPNFTSYTKEIIRSHALFGEIEWYTPSRKTHIRLGSRINYFDQLATFKIEPRFSVNYQFFDFFRLEILGELKSQSITQIIDLQQDFFGIEKRRWQLANGNDVPLMTSEQASLGLSYNHNNLLVSVEGYYKVVNDITTRSQGFQNQYQFINTIGSYKVRGVDFLIHKRLGLFNTWLGYTYSKNDYHFETLNQGELFPNTLDLRHVANASLTYNKSALQLGMSFNWHSGRPYTSPSESQDANTNTIQYKAPNGARLEDYFRTDISASYRIDLSGNSNAEVGIALWNIFNQTNIINRYYTKDAEGALSEINNESLKFTPNFSVRINF